MEIDYKQHYDELLRRMALRDAHIIEGLSIVLQDTNFPVSKDCTSIEHSIWNLLEYTKQLLEKNYEMERKLLTLEKDYDKLQQALEMMADAMSN